MADLTHDDPIGSILQRPAVTVHPDDSLRSVASVLSQESIGLAVVRGASPSDHRGEKAIGVLSERDIVQAVADGLDAERTSAAEVMTVDFASARPDEALAVVARRMLDNEIRHLLVIDGEGLVTGVVSARDLLQSLTDEVAP